MNKISEMILAEPLTGSELIEVVQQGTNKRVRISDLTTPGKSAYNIAVKAGYVGTEAAWLATLHGAKGDKGDTGSTGSQGMQGNTGLKGDKGDQGPIGLTGEQGPRGPTGLQGTPGIDGVAGPQGVAGDFGAVGLKGDKGDTGSQGLKGDKGDKGDTGGAGPVGEQGVKGIDGEKGDKGDTGSVGETGAQGVKGDTGDQGPVGPKGDGADLGYVPEDVANKGQANGYASLDGGGRIPASQLPSYVDDVIEVLDFADLPSPGETGKIYVTIDDDKLYRWSGSDYINFKAAPGDTDEITEGSTNLYFKNERVLSVPLTAISLALGTPVTSSDDIITAIGKLQAQANFNKTAAKWFLILACSDEESPLNTESGATVFRMPFNVSLTGVRASLTRVQGSGAIFTVNIKMNGVSILSTMLTVDNNEKTSIDAEIPCVIETPLLLDNSEISIHIAQVGDNTATGLKITLVGTAT